MSNAGDDLVLEAPSDSNAAARSQVYALLAEAFNYPRGAPVIRLLDGDLAAELGEALKDSPLELDPPASLITPSTQNAIQEMQIIYTDLFDVTSGTPQVSLLERRYGEIPEQKLWQELLSFYSHFGLDFSEGYAAEQPDHLLTELSFMHYLSFLEAGTTGDRNSYRRGQRDFLSLHLAPWIRQLASAIDTSEHPHPYASLAKCLAEFVIADLDYLDQCIPATKSEPH